MPEYFFHYLHLAGITLMLLGWWFGNQTNLVLVAAIVLFIIGLPLTVQLVQHWVC